MIFAVDVVTRRRRALVGGRATAAATRELPGKICRDGVRRASRSMVVPGSTLSAGRDAPSTASSFTFCHRALPAQRQRRALQRNPIKGASLAGQVVRGAASLTKVIRAFLAVCLNLRPHWVPSMRCSRNVTLDAAPPDHPTG